jgi:predicted transcriptional regulator
LVRGVPRIRRRVDPAWYRRPSVFIIQCVLNDLNDHLASTTMDTARQTFVDRMGHTGETDGMSPIAGRLFATLLLSEEPCSLDELARTLGVSKASVSTEARRLFERGMVERVTHPGDRRDYYELAADFFASTIRNRVDRWRRFQELTGQMRDQSPDLSPVVRARFDSIDEIHAFVVDRVESALHGWERRGRKGPTGSNAQPPAATHSV